MAGNTSAPENTSDPTLLEILGFISVVLLAVLIFSGMAFFFYGLGHERGFDPDLFAGVNENLLTLWKWGWLAWLAVTLAAVGLGSITSAVRREVAKLQSAPPPPKAPAE